MSEQIPASPPLDGADGEAVRVPTPAAPPVKSPAVVALYRELVMRKAKLVAELQPYRDRYEELTNAPELVEARQMIKKYNALIGPLDNELAALARALGGKALSDKTNAG